MVKTEIEKSELKERNLVKGCYGTSEWSAKSGICRGCKWKDDCGKANLMRLKN